jgi:broad specificity phosphatase PhoE
MVRVRLGQDVRRPDHMGVLALGREPIFAYGDCKLWMGARVRRKRSLRPARCRGEGIRRGRRSRAPTAALRRIEAARPLRPVLVTHEMIARMLVRNLLGLAIEDVLGRSFAQGTVYQVILPGDIVAFT